MPPSICAAVMVSTCCFSTACPAPAAARATTANRMDIMRASLLCGHTKGLYSANEAPSRDAGARRDTGRGGLRLEHGSPPHPPRWQWARHDHDTALPLGHARLRRDV